MASSARGIQSIEISGRILAALVTRCEPMMLKDLAQAADLAPAQCHAYLTSLRHVGLINQDPRTGRYRMGPFAMHLGIGWLRSSPYPSTAIKALMALTEELGFLSLIAIWGEGGPTIVHINEGSSLAALNVRQGTLYSVTGTATGRVFGAFLPPEITQDWVDSELSGSGTRKTLGQTLSRDAYETAIARVRSLGYAIADQSPIPGVNAISVPVFDNSGALNHVVSLIGPSTTLFVDDNSHAVRRLLETAQSITSSVIAREQGLE